MITFNATLLLNTHSNNDLLNKAVDYHKNVQENDKTVHKRNQVQTQPKKNLIFYSYFKTDESAVLLNDSKTYHCIFE